VSRASIARAAALVNRTTSSALNALNDVATYGTVRAATSEVFNAGGPVTMIGLDVTHQALATPEVIAQSAAIGTGPSAFAVDLLNYFGRAYRDHQGFDDPPVHDPCAVACVIDPSIVRTVRVPVDIELNGTLTLGMTVADFRAPAPADRSTREGLDVDADRFWHLVIDALTRIQNP
jgi:purine nucleosidase